MADNSFPKKAERDLPDAAMANVTHVRVVSTDNSEKLPIENLTLAGTKVTVAVDGLSGTVDGAFEDVLIQIAGKADTTQVEALDAEKVDKTSIVQTIGTSETDVMSQKAVTNELAAKVNLTGDETIAGVKTFSSLPKVPLVPVASADVASKAYADSKITKESGVNLIDPETIIRFRYLNTAGIVRETVLESYCVSAPIPVNAQNIISNATFTVGDIHGYVVYDSSMAKLRSAASQQYTYQSGDAFVVFCFSGYSLFANYGTVLTDRVFTPLGIVDDVKDEIEVVRSEKVDKQGELINLIDLTKVTRSKLFNAEGNITSGMPSNYFISDYIEVNALNLISNCYRVPGAWSGWVAYNSSKVKTHYSSSTYQYTYQEGDYYVRFSFSSDFPQANFGENLEEYQPYSGFGVFDQYQKNQIAVLENKVSKRGTILNLIDYTAGIIGAAIRVSDGGITTGFADHYFVSDYIKVNAHDIISNAWFVAGTWASHSVYDQNKNWLRTVDSSSQYTYQEGDYYVRFSFSSDFPQANFGTVLGEFIPYTGYGDLDQVSTRVYSLEKGEVNQTVTLDARIAVPNNIYSVCNDENINRNYAANLYLSHLLKGSIAEFKNKRLYFSNLDRKIFLNSPFTLDPTYNGGVNKSETVVNETILSKCEFINKAISFTHRTTLSSASKATHPKVLCIGDSITGGYLAFSNKNPVSLPNQYWAFVKMLYEMDKIDGGDNVSEYNVSLLGRNNGSFSLDYGTVSGRQIRAFAEAQGGATLQQMRESIWGGNTNPFFDGVDFSISHYLEQFRTMDDNSNRLYFDNAGATTGVGGSEGYIYSVESYILSGVNIGAQVTNTEAYDICTPTHVAIQMVQNSSLTMFQTHIAPIITIIKAELPTVKIILMGNDCVGTAFPEDYPEYKEVDIYNTFANPHGSNLGMVEYLMDTVENEGSGIFVLANLFVAPDAKSLSSIPLVSADSIESNEVIQQSNQSYGLGLYAHPNNRAHSAWGYQLYSLLKYINS